MTGADGGRGQQQRTVVGRQPAGAPRCPHRSIAGREGVGVRVGNGPGVRVVVECGLGTRGEGEAGPGVLVQGGERVAQRGRTQGPGQEGRG